MKDLSSLSEIRVLGKTYTIKRFDFDKLVQHSELLGSVSHSKQEIQLHNNDVCSENQEETLLHEILHIISRELKLEFNEDTINRLSIGIFSVLKDNELIK